MLAVWFTFVMNHYYKTRHMKTKQSKHLAPSLIRYTGLLALSAIPLIPLAQTRPNVVLIISDQHQQQASGCYGTSIRTIHGESPTPNIDNLARQGVMFTNAYTPSPLCAPARASLMTGVYPHQHTALHHKVNDLEPGHVRFPGILPGLQTIGQVFGENGYKTAAIGKMHVHGELDGVNDLGFDVTDMRFYTWFPGSHYSDRAEGDWYMRYRELPPYQTMRYHDIDSTRFAHLPPSLTVKDNNSSQNKYNIETLVEKEEQMMDHIVADISIDLINEWAAQGEPFFIHVGFENPHDPYNVPRRFMDMFKPEQMLLPDTWDEVNQYGPRPYHMKWLVRNNPQKNIARNTIASYYSCIYAMDEQVGRVVDACIEAGIYDNTIFIYTSDHGDHMYHHSMLQKHNMLETASRIPLIIVYPKTLPVNEINHSIVSLLDVLPTVTELTGIETPATFSGVSLTKPVVGKDDPERMVFSEFYSGNGNYVMFPEAQIVPMRMNRYKQYKYIYTLGFIEQLYDLNEDPDEINNLVIHGDASHKEILEKLRAATMNGWHVDTSPLLGGTAKIENDGVYLTWDALAEANEYIVYRGHLPDIKDASIVGRTNQPSFIDTATSEGQTWHYWVVATLDLTREYEESQLYKGHPVATASMPANIPASVPMKVHIQNGQTYEFTYPLQSIYE